MTGTLSSASSSTSRRTSFSSTAPPPLLTPDVEFPNPPLMAVFAADAADEPAAIPLPSNPVKPTFDPAPSPSPPRKAPVEALNIAGTIKEIQEQNAASSFSSSGSRLTSTPTSELGRFDYPFPETPAEPAPAAHHHRPNTITSRSSTTPTTARPARPADSFFARPPRLGRRGSIASGQISRLAARLPDGVSVREQQRPRSSSGSSSSPPPQVSPIQHEKRRCASSSSLSNLNLLATTNNPGISPAVEVSRPPLGPSSLSSTSVSSYEITTPSTPSSATSTLSRTVYVQPASWSRAPLSFQHAPMPAPIPPSLLARRGSVPANTLLGLGPPQGGWSNSVYKAVYHTPAMRPRKLSGEKKRTAQSPQTSIDLGRRAPTTPLGTSPARSAPTPSPAHSAHSNYSSSDRDTSPRAPSLALPSPVVQYPALSPFVPYPASLAPAAKGPAPPPTTSSTSLPLETIPSSSGEEREHE
ncbi:hypothetical protein A1Q2_00233 [Trichosporon asahii var. asahii CBS 8904]|uniref:Uncharacterized protein n=2 Tax=Trichosporon asahii var. asahii TaxID=189963 RepID=K1W0Y0_TRIAC|nr:hypothetical protein A1Q2_00233 [Trichosporon asahii var. asahii CBS 8904]